MPILLNFPLIFFRAEEPSNALLGYQVLLMHDFDLELMNSFPPPLLRGGKLSRDTISRTNSSWVAFSEALIYIVRRRGDC